MKKKLVDYRCDTYLSIDVSNTQNSVGAISQMAIAVKQIFKTANSKVELEVSHFYIIQSVVLIFNINVNLKKSKIENNAILLEYFYILSL